MGEGMMGWRKGRGWGARMEGVMGWGRGQGEGGRDGGGVRMEEVMGLGRGLGGEVGKAGRGSCQAAWSAPLHHQSLTQGP